MTHDRFVLFEAYVNQTLPEAERRALEQQLRTDATLNAELTDYQKFIHSIEAVQLNQQLDRIHTRLDRQGLLNPTDHPAQPVAPPVLRRRQRFRWPAIAGIVLLAVGSLYWFTRPGLAEQTFLTYYQPEPVSRGEAACSPNLMPGIQTYRAGRYAAALDQFLKLTASQPCVTYYVGLTQLALNQPVLAIRAFESTLKTDQALPPLIRQRAEWYLALAYLKASQPAEAQRQLSLIISQPSQPFRNVARQALADLQDD